MPKKILIVEDNAANMLLATDLLKVAGYTVLQAENAEDCFALAKKELPDLILMDIGLPGMDGIQATRQLKKIPETKDIPVVVATSHAMKGDEKEVMASGCKGYLTKPLDTRTFAKYIGGIFEAMKSGGRVLVVDDEAKNRMLLRDVLEAEGHVVTEAEDGQAALDLAAKDPPDVVLLDVMMPKMNGFEVCRRLRGSPGTKATQILMVTSLHEREDRLKGIDAGANDFITKPLDTKETALRVRNAVRVVHLYGDLQESYLRLQNLERLRDDLTHMIVHDLKSPFTAIMGDISILQTETKDQLSETNARFLQESLDGLKGLLDMINSLLDVSRLEAGKMPLKREDCALPAVADKAVDSLGLLKKPRIIRASGVEEGFRAYCDPEIIRRVMVNLMSNALRFSPGGENVTVGMEMRADLVRVWVRDKGPGIPDNFRAKIFEKFGQVESHGGRQKYTTGLGLTFCKLAVEAHGGIIGLDTAEGQGSTFWFELPQVSA